MTGKNYTISTLLLIKGFEGLELKAYPDGNAYSIGYGSQTYENGTPVKAGDTITKERAEKLLEYHVTRFANTVNTYVNVSLSQGQFDALVSFAYNVGDGAFRNSTLLKRVNINPDDFASISTEFRKWVYYKGKVLDSLVKRRESEIKQYTSKKKS